MGIAVFGAAVHDRLVATSPCLGVKLPKKPPSTLAVLTTDQVLAFADAIAPRHRAMVLTGATTGLRPGELGGLTTGRVDFLRRTIRVDQQLISPKGGSRIGPLKTPASYRTVPVADATLTELSQHLSRWPAELSFVFTTERGGPVQTRTLLEAWNLARKRVGPEWATPHHLRHYYASLLIAGGESVKVVQARLGHSSAKTTLDTYGHMWPDSEDRTRRAVELAFPSGVTSVSQGEVEGLE